MKRVHMDEYLPPYHDDVTLCLLIDSKGGRSHAVSLWNGWIFDSNLTYAIPFGKLSLDWCCADESKKGNECCFNGFGMTIRCLKFEK